MKFNYDLTRLKTRKQFLKYLNIEETAFQRACSFNSENYTTSIEKPYYRHKIPKKNKNRGVRTVWEAESNLSNIYKGVARKLDLFLQGAILGFPHKNSFGYVRGRNIRENAKCHVGAKKLLKTDINEFFPSIKKKWIEDFFISLNVQSNISILLAEFLTIEDSLPLGLATSPIISNAICHELDNSLKTLADKYEAKYSRYADDISFSSNQGLPNIEEVKKNIEEFNFTMAMDKTRILKRGQSFYVTGLSISDTTFPHTPRKMKRELRKELYFANKYGIRNHLEKLGIMNGEEQQRYINHLDGIVKYVAFHEPSLAIGIKNLWNKILTNNKLQTSYAPRFQGTSGFDFYIDETEFELKTKTYLALGLTVTRDQKLLDEKTREILDDFIADPLSDGDIQVLVKNGLHFSDATQDLRSKYIKALQKLPFKGYIVFGELVRNKKYEETYLNLLESIIKRRLISAESEYVNFYFEQNNKVSKDKLNGLIKNKLDELALTNNRHPRVIKVNVVSKKELGVSVPDFLLGVFRGYYMKSGESQSQPRREDMFFERLRDKYHIILNADTTEEFSRRKPI